MIEIRRSGKTDSPCRMFITALLLSGSAELAEAAVAEGIRHAESGEPGDVLQEVVAAAVRTPGEGRVQATVPLPEELRHVLDLPSTLRRSFVLRLLVALPLERCARLLRLSAAEVTEACGMAAQALAQLAIDEKAAA